MSYTRGKNPNSRNGFKKGHTTNFTKESKRKMGICHIGKKQTKEHIKKRIKIRKKNGKSWHSKETRKKISINNCQKRPEIRKKTRISVLKYIEIHKGWPMVGKNEKQILDELEKIFKYKIDRKFKIIGYKPDGYIPELNLVIEIDEIHHYNYNNKLKEKDIIRQKEIEKELNCKFLRIKDLK